MVKYEFEVEHYDGSMVVEDMRDPEVIAADDARVYGIFFTHEPHRQPAKLFKFTKSDWEEAELDRVAEAEVQVTNPARRNRDVLLGAFFAAVCGVTNLCACTACSAGLAMVSGGIPCKRYMYQ